jgi:hypothetical protein
MLFSIFPTLEPRWVEEDGVEVAGGRGKTGSGCSRRSMCRRTAQRGGKGFEASVDYVVYVFVS